MNTAVVLIVFNRPQRAERVLECIRQAKPSKLFVIADGARLNRPGEAQQCEATRAIFDRVDWDCTVLKNFSDINLGCKRRIASGLDWVFEQVEDAIILEDDCLPDPNFFSFCDTLLEHYRNDTRIMMVSGNNFQFDRPQSPYDYYFSRYALIWGWATWRRAWQKFDVQMKHWRPLRDRGWLKELFDDAEAVRYWTELFDRVEQCEFDCWAPAWMYSCWIENGLSIAPARNLVSNIGFEQTATNTTDANSPFANTPTQSIHLPLKHPPLMIRDAEADRFSQKTQFHQGLIQRYKNRLRRWLVKNRGYKTATERRRLALLKS